MPVSPPCCLTTMRHAVVARDGAELLEPLDPELAVASAGVAEGEHLGNAARRGLADPLPRGPSSAFGVLGIDAREHHERFQAQVAAPLAQLLRPVRRRIGGEHGHLLAAVFHDASCPRRHTGSRPP